MSALAAIALREFRSFFRLPVGWVVIALYLFLTGIVLAVRTLIPGEPASLRDFFGFSGFLLLPVAPAISMRLLSEELRSGTLESLMTAPVSDAAVIMGKFLGACLFLLAMVAPTTVYAVGLFAVADPSPDPGPILAGYLSLLLLGALYLAVGTFASSLTANQTLAFIGTLLALLVVLMLSGDRAGTLPWPLNRVFLAVALPRRLDDFAKGVIDSGNVVFFVSISAGFLTAAVVALESRRWR